MYLTCLVKEREISMVAIQLFSKYYAKMTRLVSWLYYHFVFKLNQNMFKRSYDLRVPVQSAYIDEPIFIYKYYYFIFCYCQLYDLKYVLCFFASLHYTRMMKYQI